MVKLFVGNIGATADAAELKRLFEKYGSVSECDIIRNYAFIHMKNEDEARKACDGLNNSIFEGRTIHIEFSTSKLRKAPGMDEVCFRCGDKTHKTNNCPMHDMTRDLKGFGAKRPGGLEESIPPPKRVECFFTPSRECAQSGLAYEFIAPTSVQQAPRPTADHDPLLPRPLDRNFSTLYDEYLVARERYYFIRERVIAASQNRVAAAIPQIAAAPPQMAAPTAYTYTTVPAAAAPLATTTVEYYQQAAAAPNNAVRPRQDVYYRRNENGTYEAFTLPLGAVAAPAAYVI